MPSSASATTTIYTLSLHDALPICVGGGAAADGNDGRLEAGQAGDDVGLDTAKLLLAQFREDIVDGFPRSFLDQRVGIEIIVAQLLRSEEHTSELQSRENLVCRLLRPLPRRSTLFPYTTLFRSVLVVAPPPTETTVDWRPDKLAMTSASIRRNSSSPNSAKISLMAFPVLFSINASVSR